MKNDVTFNYTKGEFEKMFELVRLQPNLVDAYSAILAFDVLYDLCSIAQTPILLRIIAEMISMKDLPVWQAWERVQTSGDKVTRTLV